MIIVGGNAVALSTNSKVSFSTSFQRTQLYLKVLCSHPTPPVPSDLNNVWLHPSHWTPQVHTVMAHSLKFTVAGLSTWHDKESNVMKSTFHGLLPLEESPHTLLLAGGYSSVPLPLGRTNRRTVPFIIVDEFGPNRQNAPSSKDRHPRREIQDLPLRSTPPLYPNHAA